MVGRVYCRLAPAPCQRASPPAGAIIGEAASSLNGYGGGGRGGDELGGTMRRYCELCERQVYLEVRSRDRYQGIARPDDHTLCGRCQRQLRDQLCAQRIGPRPWYATRATLRVLAEQAESRVEG